MIEVHQLTKRYGGKVAVDHVTFTVRPGVVTGFLGPNGAGKSTTMRLILGLDAPTSGTATLGTENPSPSTPGPCTRPERCWRHGRCTRAGRRVIICGSWPPPPGWAGGGSTK